MGDTYMLDHTGSVYLMNPAGELVSLISPQRTAADAAREISAALAQAGNG